MPKFDFSKTVIEIQKITPSELVKKACGATIGKPSEMSLDKIYQCMHSPIRTQMFYVQLKHIPTFVSVHLARHVTITPFVKSNREDRGGTGEENRYTPIDMDFIANAEALLNMSYKRLCMKASKETVYVMDKIKLCMQVVDYDLAFRMVPHCIKYRNCEELKSCGFFKKFLTSNQDLCSMDSLLDVNSWFRIYNS